MNVAEEYSSTPVVISKCYLNPFSGGAAPLSGPWIWMVSSIHKGLNSSKMEQEIAGLRTRLLEMERKHARSVKAAVKVKIPPRIGGRSLSEIMHYLHRRSPGFFIFFVACWRYRCLACILCLEYHVTYSFGAFCFVLFLWLFCNHHSCGYQRWRREVMVDWFRQHDVPMVGVVVRLPSHKVMDNDDAPARFVSQELSSARLVREEDGPHPSQRALHIFILQGLISPLLNKHCLWRKSSLPSSPSYQQVMCSLAVEATPTQ